MHKRRLNSLTLDVTFRPNGPLLIKSGLDSAYDPTVPQMSFVRTAHPTGGGETVYLPGSSLKGVIRSHSERILRTLLADKVCDPFQRSCGDALSNVTDSTEIYKRTCLACRIYGSTAIGSHFAINDAYPQEPINALETRHNVAIHRLTGAVAVGPFDMEVLVTGQFETQIVLTNFELWQVGLLVLALRDIDAGEVRVGFAKSRGLGAVHAKIERAVVRYPFDRQRDYSGQLFGVGALFKDEEERTRYGYLAADRQAVTAGTVDETQSRWGRPTLVFEADAVDALRMASVDAWAAFLEQVA